MVFALTGITNVGSLRRFAFKTAGNASPQITVVVVADMMLVRQYEIPFQELPLLCLRLLESGSVGASDTVIFAEKEMIEYAQRRSAEKDRVEQKRRARRAAHSGPQGDG